MRTAIPDGAADTAPEEHQEHPEGGAMPVDTKVGEVAEVGEVGEVGEQPEINAAEADSVTEDASTAEVDPDSEEAGAAAGRDVAVSGHDAGRRRARWSRVIVEGVLPGLVLILALVAGFLKWQDSAVRSGTARIESVAAATESTIALLSYQPETVEQELGAARDRLTGEFRDSYTQLTNDVVIPGAKEQQITALVSVPATASVSASPNRAVVLVFVNQTVTVGDDPPTDTASSVRVTLDKVDGRWLISAFDPV